MKNSIFSLKAKTFLLCLMLPLTSCTMLNSSFSSSDIPSMSSSIPSSSDISTAGSEGTSIDSSTSGISETSSEAPVSWDIPSEGEYTEGMSPTWPNQIIQNVFTSPARYSIPAFVSPSPFMYQYTVLPMPIVSIMTSIGEVDGESQYKQQLEAANWTVHEEYELMMEFSVAVDPTTQLMVFFLVSEGDMLFEISNYDPELFAELNVQVSTNWPGIAIADYLGTSVTSAVPVFVSSYDYYYLAPSDMVEFFVVFTQVDNVSALNDYSTTLLQMGWTVVPGSEPLMYVDSQGQVYLSLSYEEGYVMLMILSMEDEPTDPEIITTSTWPSDALETFLIHSFVQISIPEFSASEYSHYVAEDDLGPAMTIFSTSATMTIEDYVVLVGNAGWNVAPMHEKAGYGYYAIDPEFEIFFIIENYFGVFSITIWTYQVLLESYYADGDVPFESSTTWPTQAVADVISEDPLVPIPAFVSDFYQFRQEEDEFGPYLMMMVNATDSAPSDYQAVLVQAGYTVTATAETGTLSYVAYDPDQKVFLYYYYVEGHMTIIIRDFSQHLIGGDPSFPEPDTMVWPSDTLTNEFGATLAGLIPVLDGDKGYLVFADSLDDKAYVALDCLGVMQTPYYDYLGTLENQSWVVQTATGLEIQGAIMPYVAYDASAQIMVVLTWSEIGVHMEILPYDEVYLNLLLGNQGSEATYWPEALIIDTFSTAVNALVTPLSSEPVFYSDMFSDDFSTVWVGINGDGFTLSQVQTYIGNLEANQWVVESLIDASYGIYSYLAYDPTQTVIVELSFIDQGYGSVFMQITEYSQEIYDYEYDLYFGSTAGYVPEWPSTYITEVFGAAFTTAVPPYTDSDAYLATTLYDEGLAMEWIIVNIDVIDATSDVNTYISQLTALGWTIVTNHDEMAGFYSYLAYNPEKTAIIEFYFVANNDQSVTMWLTPYSQTIYDFELANYFTDNENPPTSAWPTAEIEAMFPDVSYTIPEFPLEAGQELSYEVDHTNHKVTVTVEGVTNHSLTMYMSVLCNESFLVYINYDDGYAVATHPSGLVTIYYRYVAETIVIEVKAYSPYEFADYYSTHIHESSMTFPSHIIESVFGLGAAQMVPTYVTTNPYTYFTQWLMFNPELQIMISSNEYEFSDYYFALFDDGWYMDGLISSGSFTAVDPTNSFAIEATIDSNGLVTIHLRNIQQQPV